MMQLLWTPAAEADLERIIHYIADESIENAIAFDVRVQEHVELLIEFPDAGQTGRLRGTRELTSSRDRYVVVYECENETISILRIFHGGQLWYPQ